MEIRAAAGLVSTYLTLPYPPTVNTYWRRKGSQYFIAPAGKRFRADVEAALAAAGVRPQEGRLEVAVRLWPPDRRRRDVDNVLKALLDGLAHGGAYVDDSQVKRLSVEMLDPQPPKGAACVTILPYVR